MRSKFVLTIGIAGTLMLSACSVISSEGGDSDTATDVSTEVESTIGDKSALGQAAEAAETTEATETTVTTLAPVTTEAPVTTKAPVTTEVAETTEVTEVSLDVFLIRVGDCFADPDSDEVTDVLAVSCDAEHKYQAYALFDVREGLLPDEDEMYELASEGCLEEFEPFVGTPYPDSDLYVTWLSPTQESWDGGDREIVCELYLEDALLSVDAKDSGL